MPRITKTKTFNVRDGDHIRLQRPNESFTRIYLVYMGGFVDVTTSNDIHEENNAPNN